MEQNSKLEFYIDSIVLISALINFCNSTVVELGLLTESNYGHGFKNICDTINRTVERINSFVQKWENDSDGICGTLKTIKEYYTYYCITLGSSSPELFICDVKYITDSVKTSKLALEYKLKKIKNKIW